MTNRRADHDVVVVGAGPAGLAVAHLLERSGRSVVVLEAGLANDGQALQSANLFAARDEPSAWRTDVSVRHTSAQNWIPYRQGKGFGGAGAINAMVCMPGDEWEDPADREAARRLMTNTYTYHPGERRLGSSIVDTWRSRFSTPDPIDGDCAEAPSLWAEDPATFTRRRFETPKQLILSTAVEDIIPGPTTMLHTSSGTMSARTVVVCAGAIQTARLVAGFAPPGTVGRAVQDHPAVRLAIRLNQGARMTDLSAPVVSGTARWRSRPESPSPDLHMLVLDAIGTVASDGDHGVVMVALMQPNSRGTLTFQRDGTALLDLHMLADQRDLERLRAGLRRIIELVSSDDLQHVIDAVFVDDKGTPLSSADYLCTDDLLTDEWLRQTAGDYSHVVGSCPAGLAAHSGRQLGLVFGTDNVWIADASLFTSIPAANTMIPTMVIAESVGRRIAAR